MDRQEAKRLGVAINRLTKQIHNNSNDAGGEHGEEIIPKLLSLVLRRDETDRKPKGDRPDGEHGGERGDAGDAARVRELKAEYRDLFAQRQFALSEVRPPPILLSLWTERN